jgi:hypothetical protein
MPTNLNKINPTNFSKVPDRYLIFDKNQFLIIKVNGLGDLIEDLLK